MRRSRVRPVFTTGDGSDPSRLGIFIKKAPAYAPGGAKHVLADSHGFSLDALLMYLVMEIHLFWKSFVFSTQNKPINLDQLRCLL
ncbi:hypothetical protein NDU88_006950 [Pleurodeles waltl]|uniref:Uncharacterized protein n=1 Tax=Pleurodeles waltl TaxID=8319 RepID=A0AAV7NRQ4_PLEWA|nr:hypothetical protein NDU88_006950 [Pleurodeles waltl]